MFVLLLLQYSIYLRGTETGIDEQIRVNNAAVVASLLPSAFDPVLHGWSLMDGRLKSGLWAAEQGDQRWWENTVCVFGMESRNQPASMAFPGCVIFLPPTAAAARFLFAAYDRW